MSRPIGFVGLLVLSLLSGCGGGTESSVSDTMEPAQAAQVFAETLQKIEAQRGALSKSLPQTLEAEALQAVRCNDPETVEGFSRAVRREITQYCHNAEDIVRNAGLTVSQFNEMMQKAKLESNNSDEEFRELFEEEWLRLDT
ncbi:DUF4168 domain-containing protein [Baaleninema sp.]|uniref:DUF4168 domain-containing protein n=1 Tax=Baaleninema sp. TaxID=3101197 RepID=UPI003CFE9A03